MISAFILSIWLIRALLSSPALPLEKWPLFAIATAFLLQRSVFRAGSPFQCIGALPAMIRASLYPRKEVFIQERKFLFKKILFFQQLQLFSDSELLWCNYTWYLVRLNLLKFYCPFCQILKFVLTFCNFFLLKKTKRSKKISIKGLGHWVELFYSSSSSHLDLFPVLQIISNCLSQIKPWRAFC